MSFSQNLKQINSQYLQGTYSNSTSEELQKYITPIKNLAAQYKNEFGNKDPISPLINYIEKNFKKDFERQLKEENLLQPPKTLENKNEAQKISTGSGLLKS